MRQQAVALQVAGARPPQANQPIPTLSNAILPSQSKSSSCHHRAAQGLMMLPTFQSSPHQPSPNGSHGLLLLAVLRLKLGQTSHDVVTAPWPRAQP